VSGSAARLSAEWQQLCTHLRPGGHMLFLVFLLIILWLLGMVTTYTLGGVLHILLVVAFVLFLVHIIQGRRIGDA
jgi:hypothetical protein